MTFATESMADDALFDPEIEAALDRMAEAFGKFLDAQDEAILSMRFPVEQAR